MQKQKVKLQHTLDLWIIFNCTVVALNAIPFILKDDKHFTIQRGKHNGFLEMIRLQQKWKNNNNTNLRQISVVQYNKTQTIK